MEVELLKEIVESLRGIKFILVVGFIVTWISLWNSKKKK